MTQALGRQIGNRLSFALILGALIPIMPLLGGPAALGLSAIYLVTRPGKIPKLTDPFRFPLVLLFGFWAGADLIFGFDWPTIRSVFGDTGVVLGAERLYQLLLISPPQAYRTIVLFLSFYLFCALFAYLSHEPIERRRIVIGLGLGFIFCSLVTVYQLLYPGQAVTPNQNEFWLALNRLPSSFSDPNAYGLVAFLGLGVFTVLYSINHGPGARVVLSITGAIFLALSLTSQSRSLVLGIILWLLVLTMLKNVRLGFGLIFLGLLCFVGLITFGGGLLANCPGFLSRSCQTLTTTSGNNSFEGRMAFIQIALAVFKDNLLFGVGLGHFDQLVPLYARNLRLGTGLWLDNANNFYLGILAETGLVGLVALVGSIFCFRSNRTESLAPKEQLTAIVIAFLILLLTGPHLNFFEVAFILAVILSFVFELSPRTVESREWYLYGLCLGGVLICSYYSQRGLYSVERDGRRLFCWTGRTAAVSVQCRAGRAELTVRALNPDLGLPVQVSFTGAGINTQISLANTNYTTVELPCAKLAPESEAAPVEIFVRLAVSRTWTPTSFNLGNDPRPLGVQLVVGES